MCECVYVCVCMWSHICMRLPGETRRCQNPFFFFEGTGVFELPNIGARNWSQDLQENHKCSSLLSHLFSPKIPFLFLSLTGCLTTHTSYHLISPFLIWREAATTAITWTGFSAFIPPDYNFITPYYLWSLLCFTSPLRAAWPCSFAFWIPAEVN